MIIFRKLYEFFNSSKLALVLLIAILISCLVGVVFLPQQLGRRVVFSSLWFNGLLVLLIINTAVCFFSRIWRQKTTFVSFGLILFHLSFVLTFIGIVFDSLFYFRGSIRLTEGETLGISEPSSYDHAEWGRFFNHEARLKGEITFHKLHTRFEVDGNNKGVANEISIREGSSDVHGFAYETGRVTHNGIKYFRNKDGFSPLIVLYDLGGREIYGAYAPIQSLKQSEKVYSYTTGTAQGPGPIPFPQAPEAALLSLQFEYYPDPKKDREGWVFFQVWPYEQHAAQAGKEPFKGKAGFGERVRVGEYFLSMNEVRYWSSMTMRYNPGLPMILTSFWIGLGGLILTTVARLKKRINNWSPTVKKGRITASPMHVLKNPGGEL